jgi:dihydrofolate reductase
VTVVAAVARNGVIGADGGLPWHLPGDLRRFKETTLGHVLVMGRRTFDSIGRALPDRTTVVVTRRAGWQAGAQPSPVLVAHSLPEALQRAALVDDEVFVVGGAEIYAEAIDLADRLRITWVDREPEGDAVFPSVDWARWVEVEREEYDGWAVSTYRRSRM